MGKGMTMRAPRIKTTSLDGCGRRGALGVRILVAASSRYPIRCTQAHASGASRFPRPDWIGIGRSESPQSVES